MRAHRREAIDPMARPLSRQIHDYVLDWAPQPWPIPWEEVFGRSAGQAAAGSRVPLVLEIGFGNGEFLDDLARANPERNYVGIERSWTAAMHLFQRLDKAPLDNVRVVFGDADQAVRNLFAEESLDEVFVNHPCPWPKARHHERRLLNPTSLALLASRMRTGARLTAVTDHAEYAAWLAEVLVSQDALESRHATVEVDEIPGRKPTKYQRKAMAQGIPIHYFQWGKVRAAQISTRARACLSEASNSMPTLTLRGTFDARDLFDGFSPPTLQEEHEGVAIVVRLSAPHRRLDEPIWLIEALVKEDQLQQEFGILVVERDEQTLLLKLSQVGRPHATYGVKRAVYRLARWIQDRRPGLEVAHENLGAPACRPFDAHGDADDAAVGNAASATSRPPSPGS